VINYKSVNTMSETEILTIPSGTKLEILLFCRNEYYYSENESPLTDRQYDLIESAFHNDIPDHTFFQENDTDPERGDKVPLPQPLGGLVQIPHNDLEKWFNEIPKGNGDLIGSAKHDGISCSLVYGETGKLISAFSKTTAYYGRDITRHVRKIPSVPKKVSGSMVIRAEIQMKESVFQEKYSKAVGGKYKTSRNMVSGRMNASSTPQKILDDTDVIAYEILESHDRGLHRYLKTDQFKILKEIGFLTPLYIGIDTQNTTVEHLITLLNEIKETYDYEIDGLVLELNDANDRKKLGKDKTTLKPKYARKFKVNAEGIETTITQVDWRVSKDRNLTGRFCIEPVEINGVTVTHASLFNAYYVAHGHLLDDTSKPDIPLGPGAKIMIVRSGDVIPHITKVISPAISSGMPDEKIFGKMEWTETGVNLKVVDEDNSDAHFRTVIHFLKTLKIEELSDGRLRLLFAAGFNTIDALLRMNPQDINHLDRIGDKIARKICNNIHAALQNVFLPSLMDATNEFGASLGTEKLSDLFDEFKEDLLDWGFIPELLIIETIKEVAGFQEKTAMAFIEGLPSFNDFLQRNKEFITVAPYKKFVADSNEMEKQVVIFSGVRSADLVAKFEAKGGVQGSMTKATIVVVKDKSIERPKFQKARDNGAVFMDIAEFTNYIGE